MTQADLAAIRRDILDRIALAAARASRDARDVEIVAVTKTVPPEGIRHAVEAGFRAFGENRVQERQAKAPDVDLGARSPASPSPGASSVSWHLVGPLQSNKARRAVELFDVIETVDSLELAERLGRIAGEIRPARPLPVLLQVNVDADDAKAGFDPDALERDLPAILDAPGLSVQGLMTVGRLVGDPGAARPTFVALRELSQRLRARHEGLGRALSMGMSRDYEVAVEEGATLVRIGSAIFGARPAVR